MYPSVGEKRDLLVDGVRDILNLDCLDDDDFGVT